MEIEQRERRADLDRRIESSRAEVRREFQAIDDNYNRRMCDMYKGWLQEVLDKRSQGYTVDKDRELTRSEEKYRREMKEYCT